MRVENTEKQLARLEIRRAKSLQQRPGLLIQKVVHSSQNTPELKYASVWTESGDETSEFGFLRTRETSKKIITGSYGRYGDRISS